MKAAVVTIRKEPFYRRAAVESGLKRLGYAIVEKAAASPGDVLVLWNLKRGREQDQAGAWEARGGHVLVLENGYLQRVDKTRYAVSLHAHNGAGWFPVGPEKRFPELGFPVREWSRNALGHWLVCGQRGVGSMAMASPPQWGEKTAARLKADGHVVRFRPHPGNMVPKTSLEDDLKGAAACIIWSSASGVRALVEGIPVQHDAPHWICEDANASNYIEMLERMAHGQWRHEEIATGEPFARILGSVKEARWP